MSRTRPSRGPVPGRRLDPRLKRLLFALYLALLAVLFLASWLGSRANRGMAGGELEAWQELSDRELLP